MRFAVLLTSFAGFIALVVAASSGCLGSDQYKCSTNVDCSRASAQGRCEAVGFCSFDDATCTGGRRFGDLSGPFANECLPPPDAAPPDAPIDAALDAFVADARECFGAGAYMMCFAGMPPMGAVTLVGTLDTTTDVRCAAMMPQSWTDAGQPDACLIMGKTINVTGALTVTGSRPLVLLGDVITIDGVIDVASHRGATTSTPGAPAPQCAAFPTTPVSHVAGSGGGAGGSFMLRGGNGGRGKDVTALGGTAAPPATVAPTVLRAGCPGQPGAGTAGALGQGGGALFITASKLTFTASSGINVSGAGAIGGTVNGGGSGGGAGGMIVIHVVENLTASGARLLANGGGGSAGADTGTGAPGEDPLAISPTNTAAGGIGPGAAGGDGFAGGSQAQSGNNANGARDSGGGGGGGGGYIQSNKPLSGATVSPAATIVP